MCGSMVDIQSPTAEIRRGNKKKKKKKEERWKKPQGGHNNLTHNVQDVEKISNRGLQTFSDHREYVTVMCVEY